MALFSKKQAQSSVLGGFVDGNLCYLATDSLAFTPAQINSVDSWKAALASLPKRGIGLRLALSSELYEVISIDRPNVEESELSAALTWAVKDLTNIPLEHQLIDYFELKHQPSGAPKLQVVVTDKRRIQPMVLALDKLKITPELITIEELALTNLLANEPTPQMLLCQTQEQSLNLVVSMEGEFVFNRPISGIEFKEGQTELDRQMQFDSLILEMQRSLDYLDRQLRLAPPTALSLLLPVDIQQWLAPQIQTMFDLPVSSLTSLDRSVQHNLALAASLESLEVRDEA